MSHVIEKITDGEYTIEIVHDPHPESPRDNYNLGRMMCSHKRYDLGDSEKKLGFSFHSSDFDTWDDVEEWLEKEQDALVTIPMSMTDHSGLYIRAGRMRDWDSGQIGFAYMTKAAAKEGWPDLEGAELVEAARKCLLAEIEEYADYVEGNVVGWVVKKGCDSCGHPEVMESCWGYIGDEGRKDAIEAAKDTIAYLRNPKGENNAELV